MAHNDYVRPLGRWPFASAISKVDLQRLDVLSTQSINGDDGGTWNPASPIVIGGTGLQMTANAQVTGGVETRSGGRIVLGDNDYIQYSPSRTIKRVVPIIQTLGGYDQTDGPHFIPWQDGIGTQSIVAASSTGTLIVVCSPWVLNGAHLMSGVLHFRIPQRPSNVNVNQINVAVGRTPVNSASGDLILVGAVSPSTPNAFFADGNPQTLAMTLFALDGVNNVIDTAAYKYAIVIEDSEPAGPTQAFPIFHSMELTFAQISSDRP